MGNKTIAAEEGALRRGQQAVTEAKEGIDKHTKVVRGDIEQLRAYWTGSAALSFTQLMTQWDAETAKLNNILLELHAALRGTEDDQAATEDEQKSVVAGLVAMMTGGNN
ncbi:MAG: WXG100 family type VII secretion target [Leucobacter sp.]